MEIARNELVIMVSIEAKFLINFSREDGIINRTGSSFADSTERAHHKSIFQMWSHEVRLGEYLLGIYRKLNCANLLHLGGCWFCCQKWWVLEDIAKPESYVLRWIGWKKTL